MSSAATNRRSSNWDANRLLAEDEPVHAWYRFVLSFPPQLVRQYLDAFEVKPTDRVLDPFCGTGTVLVECKKLGVPSVGIEAHPMAQFATQVKVDWSVDPDEMVSHATRVASAAAAELGQDGIHDIPLLHEHHQPTREYRSLPAETERLLLKGSISPLPLHKTLVLRECIEGATTLTFRDHELLALTKALISSIGNLHFGPEVGVTRPKGDVPVIEPWLDQVRTMAGDLRGLSGSARPEVAVHLADSRASLGPLNLHPISAVITSPPYPNEKDYTRITRLESVILGLIKNRADLRALKQHLVRSNTRNVYKNDDDDAWVADDPEIGRIADAIESRRRELGKTSGFERLYASVTKLYFGGMKRHLAELRQYLRPGAQLAYVVGDQASYLRVMIRTGQILARIAESLGYEVLRIDLFRTRLATATREQLREEVVVLRWGGT